MMRATRTLLTLALAWTAPLFAQEGPVDPLSFPPQGEILPILEKHLAQLSSGAPMEKYLLEQFKRAGLKSPYPRGRYSQEYEGGLNVVGTIEGRHPQFRNQYVIVAVEDPREYASGRPARGASTGAAPNAVLLTVAGMLAQRPCQRSLLFVSFNPTDERGRGADHFFSHLPVPAEQAVLCVHLGCLGRAYGDFMSGVVWAAGIEYCPELEELTSAATADAGLYVLPAAAEVLHLAGSHEAAVRRRLPSLLFSSGEHKDSGLPSDRAAELDTTMLARFTRYLASLVQLMGNARGTGQCRPEPAPFAGEFCSYAVECGVLLNLDEQARLPFKLAADVMEDASKLRAVCIDLCDTVPLPVEEARRIQRVARNLNQEILRAVRQRRARATEPTLADLAPAGATPALSDFAPPDAVGGRADTRQAPEFVIPEGGIEVIDMTTPRQRMSATPELQAATAVVPQPAGPEIALVTPPRVVRPASPQVRSATPPAPPARIKPSTAEAPTKVERKPDANRFLRPPAWLER